MLPLLVACASSGGGGARVGGYFDDTESDAREERAYGGGGYVTQGAPAYEPSPPPAAASPLAVSAATMSVSETASVFGFAGEAIKGALSRPDGNKVPDPPARAPDPSLPNTGAAVPTDKSVGDKPPAESSAAKRLVIYKGALTVMVAAVEPSVEKLAARAAELGGYVENQSGNSGANSATIMMRVPAEKFYALVNELGTYGQVTQKNVTASDVTKTVFDIELRLETAEKSRQRLLDLLKVATEMEEILQIENEVRRLTQEIEGMKGELRFLKDQVAFSTLAVTFFSNAPPPNQGPTRTRSRFEWINQVGVESVLYNF